MAISTGLTKMSRAMIRREGQPVSMGFVQDGAYDPSSGTNATPEDVTVLTWAVILESKYESRGDTTYFGTLVEKDDKECYLSSEVAFPRHPNASGDYLIDAGGNKWRIIVSKQDNPSGSAVIKYNLLLRR